MAIAFLNSVSFSGPNGGTSAALNTTGAKLLIAANAWYSASSSETFTDSASNTWTPLTRYTLATTGNAQFLYCLNPTTSASHTFTTAGTQIYGASVVSGFSGVLGGFDVQNGGSTATNSTTIQPGSITPTQNGELVISSVLFSQVVSAITVDSGLSINGTITYVAATNYGIACAYLIQGTAAAINPTWSWTSAVGTAYNIASFSASPLPGAGGGGGYLNRSAAEHRKFII